VEVEVIVVVVEGEEEVVVMVVVEEEVEGEEATPRWMGLQQLVVHYLQHQLYHQRLRY